MFSFWQHSEPTHAAELGPVRSGLALILSLIPLVFAGVRLREEKQPSEIKVLDQI